MTTKKSTLSLVERDQNVIWHPFTQMKTADPPIAIVRGEGTLLFDENGDAYIDAIASWWMNLHGHAHPYLGKKLAEQFGQLEHVIFAGFTHEPAVRLAERVIEKLPNNQVRFFYSDNGSTAVEVGIKMCFQYWYNKSKDKKRIIALEGSYHGDTFGAMSVGDRSAFSAPFDPFLFDVSFIPAPIPGQEEASIKALTELLENEDVAGLIVEPLVQGAAGMLMYSPESLETMFKLAKSKGALLIADEVMTGFGRTGKFFACDHIETKPDIVAMSKGLTGGTMALGATSCSQEVYDAFYSDDKMKTLFHGHSCTGNPLACSVGLASMDLMDKQETKDAVLHIIKRHEEFAEKLKALSNTENIRQQGVIIAFEVKAGERSYFNTLRDEIWEYFISRKVLLRPLGNTIYILPPYCITDEELDRVYGLILDFLETKR